MSKEKALVVQKKEAMETSTFIQQAITAGLPIETMEKLFALHERNKANLAKEAYISSLAKFQSECPVIQATKKVLNKDGRSVRYQYAPIGAIVEQIKKPLSNNDLSYRWEVKNEADFIEATAIVTHKFGHSESSSFKVPIDKEGFMTAPQKYASALTFAKRYALIDVLGISTGDEDTDATDVGKEPDVKSTKAKIVLLLRSLGEEPKTGKETEEAIKRLTKLEPIIKNFPEVVSRLELLVSEKNNDHENN